MPVHLEASGYYFLLFLEKTPTKFMQRTLVSSQGYFLKR